MTVRDDTLMIRLLAGEATPEEEAAFAQRCSADAGLAAEWARALVAWGEVSRPGVPDVDANAMWAEVAGRVDGRASGVVRKWRGMSLGRRTLRRSLSIVAVLTLIIALGIGQLARRPNVVIHRTATGQRSAVTLRDGTHIVLAPGTTLRIHGVMVELSGEALFMVPHRPQRSLTVQTDQVKTQVLGTVFDVRHYPEDIDTRVVVREGRVTTGIRRRTTLSAGTLARVSDSAVTIMPSVDVNAYTAWTRGTLAFRETPVREALTILEHWYGVQFYLSDSALVRQHVTTDFTDCSRDEMLAALVNLLDVTLTIDRKHAPALVILHSRRSVRMPVSRHEAPAPFSPLGDVGR